MTGGGPSPLFGLKNREIMTVNFDDGELWRVKSLVMFVNTASMKHV